MSNLLPESVRQRIRNEYRARFLLTGSALAISAAVFTALAFSPSFAVLFVTRPATLKHAQQMEQSKVDTTEMSKAQALLAQVAPIYAASSTATSAMLEALALKPSGVHIDSIAYMSGAAASITLGGSTDNRTNIDKYRTLLQADQRFTSVKLPVGDLVGAQTGRFTITLNGNF